MTFAILCHGSELAQYVHGGVPMVIRKRAVCDPKHNGIPFTKSDIAIAAEKCPLSQRDGW